ncbi:hypothetical protein LAD67_06025 [Escherichia coli]|nr:hypothetical protein [Escherichia coli]
MQSVLVDGGQYNLVKMCRVIWSVSCWRVICPGGAWLAQIPPVDLRARRARGWHLNGRNKIVPHDHDIPNTRRVVGHSSARGNCFSKTLMAAGFVLASSANQPGIVC